jgi:hypothetical protein
MTATEPKDSMQDRQQLLTYTAVAQPRACLSHVLPLRCERSACMPPLSESARRVFAAGGHAPSHRPITSTRSKRSPCNDGQTVPPCTHPAAGPHALPQSIFAEGHHARTARRERRKQCALEQRPLTCRPGARRS